MSDHKHNQDAAINTVGTPSMGRTPQINKKGNSAPHFKTIHCDISLAVCTDLRLEVVAVGSSTRGEAETDGGRGGAEANGLGGLSASVGNGVGGAGGGDAGELNGGSGHADEGGAEIDTGGLTREGGAVPSVGAPESDGSGLLISSVLDEVGDGRLVEVGGGGTLGLEVHGGGLRVEEVGGGVGALESAGDGVGESDITANVSVDDGEVVARDRASSDLVGVSSILIDGQTARESGIGNPVAAGSLVE